VVDRLIHELEKTFGPSKRDPEQDEPWEPMSKCMLEERGMGTGLCTESEITYHSGSWGQLSK
jgi:hypothetical protein